MTARQPEEGVRRYRWALILVAVGGCATGPAESRVPVLGDADLRVAFVGNSLTFVNDVPRLVQAMADSDERSMAHVTLTQGGFSLEDHWYAGVPEILRDVQADVVILQQGPSSLPENREHLIHWSRRLAAVIREAGGEPALYMVWPSRERAFAFPDVWTSYRLAADSADAAFIPAGQTWVEAWALDETLPLYGSDGFHQSYLGALAAAQTIYAVLFQVPADSVPSLDDTVSPEIREILRAALAESLRLASDGAP